MSNDKDIKMADNIGSQVVEKVGNGLERAYNAVMSTGAGEKFREKYQEYFHKEPTKKEIADFGLRFSTTVKENSEINGAIDNKIEAGNVQAAKYFKETFAGTTRDQLTGVKYGEKDDGYTYIIGEHEMVSKISDHEKLIGALEQNTNEMEKFAAQKYNTKIEDVKKNFEVLGSVFVAKTGKVEYFGRYKR